MWVLIKGDGDNDYNQVYGLYPSEEAAYADLTSKGLEDDEYGDYTYRAFLLESPDKLGEKD